MENESKKCFNCKHLERYYTKEIKQFCKTKFGWCSEKRNVVDTNGGCEQFGRKPVRRGRHRLLQCSLSDLLTEISEIRKVLEAEKSEREEM